MRRALTAALLTSAFLATTEAAAQTVNGQGYDEIRLLREAESYERAGDLNGAERIYERVLAGRATSLSAILGLERVLHMQGRIEEILPYAERLLARDPRSPIGHQMMMRVLSRLDRVQDMEAAATAWTDAVPNRETPYREIARLWNKRGATERAIRALERGRARLGDDALAVELGALYAELGEARQAAREWNRAIGERASGVLRVSRQMASLPDGGAGVRPLLVDALMSEPTTLARRQAAARLAISGGLGARSLDIVRSVANDLPAGDLENFLVEVARRADGVRLYRVAYWGYGVLLAIGDKATDDLAVRNRAAELALMVGDTVGARRHYEVIERSYEVGSPMRRKATAVRIRLMVRDGAIDEARDALASFRGQYPKAPELDSVAAVLAAALLREDRVDDVEQVLEGVRGPHSSVLRAHLLVRHGEFDDARATLLRAAAELDGARATEAIGLATLLGRLSDDAGRILARGMTEAVIGRTRDGLEVLVGGADGLPPAEAAAILDYAAELADNAGLIGRAARIRRTIIAEYPDAAEVPAALLALARSEARRPGGIEEARQLLVHLVLNYADSALVPQARRELNELGRRVPRS